MVESYTKELTMSSPPLSERRLSAGAVPSKIGGCTAETGEEKDQKGEKKETERGRRGGRGIVPMCGSTVRGGVCIELLMFAGHVGEGDGEVYDRG